MEKGAILGFAGDGLLTDRFGNVVGRFVVKSTDPYGVGGDNWGSEERVCAAQGCKPVGDDPAFEAPAMPSEIAPKEEWDAYEVEVDHASQALTAAVAAREQRRQDLEIAYEVEKRDRIAKSG